MDPDFSQSPARVKKTAKTPVIERALNPLKLQVNSKSSYVCYHAFDEELKYYANNNSLSTMSFITTHNSAYARLW